MDEQRLKIEASGLEHFFQRALILAEKDAAAYRQIRDELALDADQTWMIGNSPRSDINPALAAGLNAVFIPHPHTWSLEHEEVVPVEGRSLLTLVAGAGLSALGRAARGVGGAVQAGRAGRAAMSARGLKGLMM